MNPFLDRRFRLPRKWSNRELEKVASLFSGDVVNVSGWIDVDKEGKHYKDYFENATSYAITNHASEKGYQGAENEIPLDLEKPLPDSLVGKFDVVFNHTTLEHIYDVQTAFKNLCLLTKDIVIVVVPFLQQMHQRDYGDYWRFTPLALQCMFEENKMSAVYISFNHDKNAAVYVFAVGSKQPQKWAGKMPSGWVNDGAAARSITSNAGYHAIQDNRAQKIWRPVRQIMRNLNPRRRARDAKNSRSEMPE